MSRLTRNTAFALLAQQALHAGLGNLLYPSIEEKFIALGIDEHIVAEMDLPPFAFVRPAPQDRNYVDHLYALTDVPTFIGMILSRDGLSSYTHGKTLPYPVCDIMLSGSDGLVKSWVRNATLLPDNMIAPVISDEDAAALILAHEIGHCDWEEHVTAFFPKAYESLMEGTLPTLMEREIRRAEFHSDLSVMAFARRMEDSKANSMMDFLIASRNSFQYYFWNADTGYAYDYGPSLDAIRREEKPFTLADFKNSRREIADYIAHNLSYQTLDDYTQAMVGTLDAFIQQNKDDALPLSMQRAKAFIAAIEYFAPELRPETIVADIAMEDSAPSLSSP